MTCIYCFEQILTDLSWQNIVTGIKSRKLCFKCTHSFLPLGTSLCLVCSVESKSEVCFDCLKWSDKHNNVDVLTKNYSIFKYNEFAQEFLARWKYQADFILIDGIEELIKSYINKTFNFLDETYTIVPIPLSENRLYERGFNQATSLAKLLGEVEESLLSRESDEKQSKKTKQERINSLSFFKLNEKITGKFLLVDDIYTTGATIRHAAKLLKKSGASEVRSFTFIRS